MSEGCPHCGHDSSYFECAGGVLLLVVSGICVFENDGYSCQKYCQIKSSLLLKFFHDPEARSRELISLMGGCAVLLTPWKRPHVGWLTRFPAQPALG